MNIDATPLQLYFYNSRDGTLSATTVSPYALTMLDQPRLNELILLMAPEGTTDLICNPYLDRRSLH